MEASEWLMDWDQFALLVFSWQPLFQMRLSRLSGFGIKC
jgi:hypothetical protein